MFRLLSDEIKFFIVEKAYQHETYETIVEFCIRESLKIPEDA